MVPLFAAVVEQERVGFEVASDVLSVGSQEALVELADVLRRYPQVRVEVQGHASAEGKPEDNQALSEARARAVVSTLLEGGLDPASITSKGYGATRPRASNDSPGGRQLNRRVEVRPWLDVGHD